MDQGIKRSRAPAVRMSRRGFFSSAGAAGGGLLAASSLPEILYAGDNASGGISLPPICELPNPIPHAAPTPFGPIIHGFFPGPVEGTAAATDPTGAHPNGRDPSSIFDFNGFIGQADLRFTGTGTDLNTGIEAAYTFNADVRFMDGMYVGADGKTRRKAFAFI